MTPSKIPGTRRSTASWPEWAAVAAFATATIFVLLPSRPTQGDAVPLAPLPVAIARTITSPIVLTSRPLGADALQFTIAGIPTNTATEADAQIDGHPAIAVLGANRHRSVDVAIPIRFIVPGRHLVNLTLTTLEGDTQYTASGELAVTIAEGRAVSNRTVPDARDVIDSVDAITDGKQQHVVAAGQSDFGATLSYGQSALAVEGWAATTAHSLPAAVLFRVDDGPLRQAELGDDRPDVAKAFATSALAHAGFTARLSTTGLRSGPHRIDFFVVPRSGAAAENIHAPIHLLVSAR